MNLELYINNRLCDIESPEKLGITLKRVFINPSELSIKDAQKSYDISLPATPVNNEIFNYANIEETQGKFKIYGDARLYVNGVLILDGKFRLSEITKDYYRGNLGVPAPITVKDIFGETMMNQAGKWMIPFRGVEDITNYNTDGYKSLNNSIYGDISPCIFPFVLYKLMAKEKPAGSLLHTNKDILDDTVVFDKDDFPPSINCIHLIEKIFSNADYRLSGSALNDERLRNLYMSYKNKNEFILPWSVSEMKVSGKWSAYDKDGKQNFERKIYRQTGISNGLNTVTVNLFDSENVTDIEAKYTGDNIKIRHNSNRPSYKPSYGSPNIIFTIPRSGFYKVVFKVNFRTIRYAAPYEYDGLKMSAGGLTQKHEIKLVRNYNEEKLKNERFDNTFYKDNIDQEIDSPIRHYPQYGEVNFIDQKQNPLFISGMSYGYSQRNENLGIYYNPVNDVATQPCVMAIKGGPSWDRSLQSWVYSAVNSEGYVDQQKKPVNMFKVELRGIPNEDQTGIKKVGTDENGCVAQVIWLDAGDTLSVVSISNLSEENRWYNYGVDFSLSVKPYMLDLDWLKLDEKDNNSTQAMRWDEEPTFEENMINLIQFLLADMKINDWIENFCKAFNLSLTHASDKSFELNIKDTGMARSTADIIDLDSKASVTQRSNESLKLPNAYELGFTIDTSEQGFHEKMETKNGIKLFNSGETGGGQYNTGSMETAKVSQTSSFSYCWYKELTDTRGGQNKGLNIPVITDHKIWEDMSGKDYEQTAAEMYYDKALRFWYKSPDTPLSLPLGENKTEIKIATVQETFAGSTRSMMLNYKDEANSIMRNYFVLMVDTNNSYTSISCLLTPEEYKRLNRSCIKLNGDLYYVAEADGYDPLGKNQTKLKLIRQLA